MILGIVGKGEGVDGVGFVSGTVDLGGSTGFVAG